MKNILKYLIISIGLFFSLPAFADSNLYTTGLWWEYYDYYTHNSVTGVARLDLTCYTLKQSTDDKSDFFWEEGIGMEYFSKSYGDWVYVRDIYPSSKPLKIREEGNKIYVIITPAYAEWHGLYEVDEDAEETRMEIPGFEDEGDLIEHCKKIKIEADLPVLLYDFDAEVGDRYTTLLYGKLLNTVTVVDTSFRDDVLGGVKEVKILADCTKQRFRINYESDSEWDESDDIYTISYLEKIGNITSGTFTDLNPFWYTGTGYKSFETVINNVYIYQDVVYKGKGFDPNATVGITDVRQDLLNEEERIYDLHGRQISNPVRGSIYIRDGRKFVAE